MLAYSICRIVVALAGALTLAGGSPSRSEKGSHAIYKSEFQASEQQKPAPGPGPNGLAMTPTMGWMSWEIFRCEVDCVKHPSTCVSEKLYMQITDHLAADGYVAVGYTQVSIDDCWENIRGRDKNRRLIPDAARFPSGMLALGDYMHSKNVLFGTYSDEGTKTCGGYPGSKGHETDDSQNFASWGVDYLKLDGCYNRPRGYAIGYPAMGAALQASGRNITYSCSWPAYLGNDESRKPFGAMVAAGCNSWRNWDDIQCNWGSLSSIIDHWGDYGSILAASAGPGHWHDMDMLLIGNDCISIEEERTQMAIWAISASNLFMGNDVRSIPAESRAILLNRDAIDVNQDPLGKMGIRSQCCNSSSPTQIWSRTLANDRTAVALYNKGFGEGKAADITLAFKDVGLSGSINVYDIWAQKDIGVFRGSYTAKDVPDHGSAFLRLSRDSFADRVAVLV